MRTVWGLGLAFAIANCAPAVPGASGAPLDRPTAPIDGACGAGSLQALVGRDRAQIPPASAGQARRVHARGDMLTMDYSPTRLNIEYDPATGRVLRVYCG